MSKLQSPFHFFFFFFFNDTAPPEIYTFSLHDALPIPRRELDDVTRAAVRAQLREARNVGARDQAAHPLRGVGVGRVRPGVAEPPEPDHLRADEQQVDRKSTRLNSSHLVISYAVFCLKK